MKRQIGEWPQQSEIDAYMGEFKAKVAAAKRILAAFPSLLTDKPHPAIPELTLRDFVDFRLQSCGLIGELKAIIVLEHLGMLHDKTTSL